MSLRKRDRPPGFIEPCLPSPGAKLPVHGAWLHEVKIDGYRLLARRDATGVRLFTRHATDWTARFPIVAAAIAGLPCASCLIDGEVAAPDAAGLPSFDALRRRAPAMLFAFDLIELDGRDLRHEPIEARKAALVELVTAPKAPGIIFNEHIEGPAQEIFEHACRLGYEGIVCKRMGSRYASGRSTDWLKLKNPDSAAVRREREIKRR